MASPAPEPGTGAARPRTELLGSLALVLMVLLVYGQAVGFDFTNYDDPFYVTGNRHVLQGLGWEGVRWAFTTDWASNWHPLTWLSHMADVTLFGRAAGLHHLVNVAFHAANAVLLFRLLSSLTRSWGPSLVTAALFALHPLHVESVAWVAERKDVLSMLFALLTLAAYARWTRTGSRRVYAGALVLYALGLMAKPMLVSLPLLLGILDLWPLRRRPSLPDKVPFAVLAGLSCAVTYAAQRSGGSVAMGAGLPLTLRLLNALASCGRYLGKAFLPVGLTAHYPFLPHARLVALALVSGLVLGALSWAVWVLRARRPYLLAGWLWYLAALLPVLGLVQVGLQSMADRYTYLPLVGPMFALTWLVKDLAQERGLPARAPGLAAVAALSVLGALAWRQAGFWRSSEALFGHAVQVDPDNYVARTNLGLELCNQGRDREALPHLLQAVRLLPGAVKPHYFLARDLARLGRREEALAAYKATLDLAPRHYDAMFEAASLLVDLGRDAEAQRLLAAFLDGAPARARGEGDPAREQARTLQAQAMLDLIQRRRPLPPSRKP